MTLEHCAVYKQVSARAADRTVTRTCLGVENLDRSIAARAEQSGAVSLHVQSYVMAVKLLYQLPRLHNGVKCVHRDHKYWQEIAP